jgi:hypothetical protein
MIDRNMELWIIVGLVTLVVLAIAAIALARGSRHRARQRSLMLRERFGPEYERTVERYGRRAAERVLAERVQRVENIRFRELSDAEHARYTSLWTTIQAQFVDDPRTAVARANELIKEVMRARGYSADTGFEQRAADLSVDHPDVVEHYRAAHDLAQAGAQAKMNTEQLRQAIVHYRALFADLLQPTRQAVAAPLRPAHV